MRIDYPSGTSAPSSILGSNTAETYYLRASHQPGARGHRSCHRCLSGCGRRAVATSRPEVVKSRFELLERENDLRNEGILQGMSRLQQQNRVAAQ